MESEKTDKLLYTKIISNLLPSIGRVLKEVYYNCLTGEATLEDVAAPLFYTGGEVELRFTDEADVFITWDENAGWQDHFSIQVCTQTVGNETAIPFDVTEIPMWQGAIGNSLDRFEILGWDQVPHVICFYLGSTKIFVGDGYRNEHFGDGDDLLICSETEFRQFPFKQQIEKIWDSRLNG